MAESTEQAVVAALEVALRDHGWIAASDPARLRATLSDLLGAHADEHRGALDAIVVSAEEGVPAELRSAGRSGAVLLHSDLVARLVDWGMATDRAAWVVDAWQSLVPESTLDVPVTAPPEPAPPEPAPPEPEPAPEPEPEPELPPATPDVTALPQASGGPGHTDLPPAADAPAAREEAAQPVATELPQLPPTSLPPAVQATSLPPAARPALEDPQPREPAASDEQPGVVGPARRGRLPWIAAAVALVVLAGAGVAVALNGDDDEPSSKPDPTDTSTPTGSPSPTLPTLATGQPVAAPGAAVPEAAARVAMGGLLAGVRVTAFGVIDEAGTGDDARVAEDGAHLVGFTIAKGPCNAEKCGGWKGLGLRVAVDGRMRKLPKGGPTFAVAADEDAEVELVYEEAGFDQRVSLLTGDATGQNIQVLGRADRMARIDDEKTMNVTASGTSETIDHLDRVVKVGAARLYFFEDDDVTRHPERLDRALLHFELSYRRPGATENCITSTCGFKEGVVRFEVKGVPYVASNVSLDPDVSRLVCVVPADVKVGTLVIGGAEDAVTNLGAAYTANLQRTTFRVDFRR